MQWHGGPSRGDLASVLIPAPMVTVEALALSPLAMTILATALPVSGLLPPCPEIHPHGSAAGTSADASTADPPSRNR